MTSTILDNSLDHIRSAQYHLQSNDQAARYVDTSKKFTWKLEEEEVASDVLQPFPDIIL